MDRSISYLYVYLFTNTNKATSTLIIAWWLTWKGRSCTDRKWPESGQGLPFKIHLIRAHLTPDAYRLKFKSDSKHGEESFEEFANRLKDYFHRWVEISQATADLPEVKKCLNLVMIDQFLSTIADEGLRLKLREKNESSLIALACTADWTIASPTFKCCPPYRWHRGQKEGWAHKSSFQPFHTIQEKSVQFQLLPLRAVGP